MSAPIIGTKSHGNYAVIHEYGPGVDARMQIVQAILMRRNQQISKGYDAAHDDSHPGGELACAAATYALTFVRPIKAAQVYPWLRPDFDGMTTEYGDGPFDPTRHPRYFGLLTDAAALLVAEMERVIRYNNRRMTSATTATKPAPPWSEPNKVDKPAARGVVRDRPTHKGYPSCPPNRVVTNADLVTRTSISWAERGLIKDGLIFRP